MSGSKPDAPAPTAQEKALAKVGAEQWNDYARRYAGAGGVNEKFIEATRATEADRTAAAGQVGADAAMAGRDATAGTARAGLARGISSASGATISAHSADNTSMAATEGRAKGMAVQGVDDAQLAADFKLASFGRGLGSDAQVGMRQMTARATELVNKDAMARAQEKQDMLGAVGTGIGMYSQMGGLGKKSKPKKMGNPWEVSNKDVGDLGW